MTVSPQALLGARPCGEWYGHTGLRCNAVVGHRDDHTVWSGLKVIKTWVNTSKSDEEER